MIFHSAVQQQLSVNFLFFPDDTKKVFLKPNYLFLPNIKKETTWTEESKPDV